MANFREDFQNPKPSSSFSLMNPNMELLNNFGAAFEDLNSNVNHGLVDLPNEGFLDHHHQQVQPQLPMSNFTDPPHNSIPNSSFHSDGPFYDPVTNFLTLAEGSSREGKSAVRDSSDQTDTLGMSPDVAHHMIKNKKYCSFEGKKRKRSNDMERPREVVHVRAKRGQATDSHSLAERLRREKINEKLRCLQDLVPGCYKTMGMAVMLDVITNYVRSLQNQIEFLSMKLSAASLFYDFNSDQMDGMETVQGTNGYEAQGMERMVGDHQGYGGGEGGNVFQLLPSTWPSLT